MDLTNEQRLILKGKGYLSMKDGIHFSCRVVISAAKMTAAQAQALSHACEKWGRGYFTLTQRGNVQIPWVNYEDLDTVAQELAGAGLAIGGTGPRVRPAHNCKGTVCRFGLYDTEAVAQQINKRFYQGQYDNKLPSKFRIALSGCHNNCAKTKFACFGLQGKKMNQVSISLGGCSGRNSTLSQEISGLYSLPEALDILEKTLQFYRENGQSGERFAQTIERLSLPTVEKAILDR